MTKILTFKKRKDFLRVAQGFHVATHNMVLQATPSLSVLPDIFVGYTATKKIGNAVIRNRSKRRMRAVVRNILANYAFPHIDYVFIARQSTANCDFQELQRDAIYALKRINKNFIPTTEESVEQSASSIEATSADGSI